MINTDSCFMTHCVYIPYQTHNTDCMITRITGSIFNANKISNYHLKKGNSPGLFCNKSN